jgi:hypothetical protein
LTNLRQINEKKIQINKIRYEKVDITINTNEIRGSLRKTKNLHSYKLEHLEEMDAFLDSKIKSKGYKPLKQIYAISNDIKVVIKTLSTKKNTELGRFTAKFCQTFKELTSMLLKVFHKTEREGMLSNSFYETTITLLSKPNKDTTK